MIKRIKSLSLLLLTTLALAGCATADSETGRSLTDIVRTESGRQADTPECTVPKGLIGKPHEDLLKLKLTSPVRVIFPGNVVPSDSVSNRLNVKVDKKGIIKSITCG